MAITPPAPRTPASRPRRSPDPGPFRNATLLPARAYHDQAIFDWEREEIFFRDWIAVGRAEEVQEPTSFVRKDVLGEDVIVVRGRDNVIRAFYNVCRHRGTAVEERECGKAVRFQCLYHAWIYDLDGQPRPGQAHRRPRGLQLRDLRPRADPLRGMAAASCSCASPTRPSRRRCASTWATGSTTTTGFGRDLSTLRGPPA